MLDGGELLGRAVLELVTDPTKMRQGLASAKDEALNTVRGAQQALSSAGARMDQAGQKITLGITIPIVAAGKAILDVGTNFDTTLRQIVGLTDVTSEEIGGIRSEILKLGGDVGKTPQELAEAFYFVASAGFKADEALEVLRTSARASAAGLGRVQDIAKVLGLTINAYGHENITSARAADILTAAVKDGTAEADAFAGVLGRVVPTAATLGVSFDQVTAALASMTLTGLSADEASTSLNQVLVSLLKPTKEAAQAMLDMGLNADELRKELRERGLLDTLRTLETAFAGNDEAASQVFGNIRALRGVLSLLTLDSAQLNKVFADTKGALGDLEAGYQATEGPARELARAQAELDAALIDLSQDVLPIAVDLIHGLVDAVKGIVGAFRSLPAPVREAAIRILALVAAIGPVLLIGGKLVTALGSILGLVLSVSTGIATKLIPALTAFDLSAKGLLATLGPLLPILGILAYHIDRITKLQGDQHEIARQVIDDQQWVLDHPGVPLIFRGIAEALGLVAKEGPPAADAIDGVRHSLADIENEAQDVREAARIAAASLPAVGEAYQNLAVDVDKWRKKMQEDHDAALQAQLDYTSKALAALQQFRKDIEDAYKVAQDAQLDMERTSVAIAEKQIELTALDEEYTKQHGHWTKIQGKQWQLRKDEALAEMNALRLHLALIGDDIQQTAGLKSLLASKEMKDGLTSKNQEVVAAYRALRDEAITKLNELAKKGGKASKDAAAAVAKYMDPANPISPFNDSATWGANTGNAFVGALTHALRVTPAMRAAMGRIGGFLEADSPPRDPTNALHNIDDWGERTGNAWVNPFVRTLEAAAARARAPMSAVRAALSVPYSLPGMATAAATAGIGVGGGFARNDAASWPAGGRGGTVVEKHYHLTVTGDLVARDKDEVLATLQRMDAIGRDD